jgi:hypothetical protein
MRHLRTLLEELLGHLPIVSLPAQSIQGREDCLSRVVRLGVDALALEGLDEVVKCVLHNKKIVII